MYTDVSEEPCLHRWKLYGAVARKWRTHRPSVVPDLQTNATHRAFLLSTALIEAELLHMWQPRHMRLLQSASFFTPTLGDELRLLTNNGATSSEPLAHKNAPNSFFGHQVGSVKEAESIISKPRGKKTTKKVRATGANEKATTSKCTAKVSPPGNL